MKNNIKKIHTTIYEEQQPNGINILVAPMLNRPINASRLHSFPLLGYFFKLIFLFPASFSLGLVALVLIFIQEIHGVYILITRKYLKRVYLIGVELLAYYIGIQAYLFGITDSYPSIPNKNVTWPQSLVVFPKHPGLLLSLPIVSFIFRIVILIPIYFWFSIVSSARMIGVILGNIPVFITKRYPESIYEVVIDTIRMEVAFTAYILKLTDQYPSFRISWNHPWKKISLLVLGLIFYLLQVMVGIFSQHP